MANAHNASVPRVAIIDGTRTPFQRSGTGFVDIMQHELAAAAIRGLLDRTQLPPEAVQELVLGCTIQNHRTNNVARDAGLAAGLPHHVNAHMVSAACISANRAIGAAAEQILRGHADVAIAGGVETLSDPPIQYQRKLRKKFLAMGKAKGWLDYLKLFSDVRPRDLRPDLFAIAEYSTGLSMGQNADRLAKRLEIPRAAQDEFAVRSHQTAGKAQAEGRFDDEITPVQSSPDGPTITTDNGPRADTTLEKVAKLRPAFAKDGTVTAASSSFLTDGAAVVLLTSEAAAEKYGLKPKGYLHAYAYAGTDPLEELLVGPAYATPTVLDRAGLTFDDIDVLEIHEAFAVQVLAVLKLLASDQFARDTLGRDRAVGRVDPAKLNTWGGSLSIGHPFGATGARLITTCLNRLHQEDGTFGLVAACGAGGCGTAVIVERA